MSGRRRRAEPARLLLGLLLLGAGLAFVLDAQGVLRAPTALLLAFLPLALLLGAAAAIVTSVVRQSAARRGREEGRRVSR
jgi:hypothetical protein